MKGKIAPLEKEIDAAFQPILARLKHYRCVINTIYALLHEFFFDSTRTQRLTEAAKGNEIVFNFNQVREAMEKCLINEQNLLNAAQEMQATDNSISFVSIFDDNVLYSGLAINLQDDGFYSFTPEKPYTSNANTFMQQFAAALGIYRSCLRIFDSYYELCSHSSIQTDEVKYFVNAVEKLKQQQLEEHIDLTELHKQTSMLKKQIMDNLNTTKVREGLDGFKHIIDSQVNKLPALLETTTDYIEKMYVRFPNDAIFWMFHDRSWHQLLKDISSLLCEKSWTYSTRKGTLTIYREFINVHKAELEYFSPAMLNKIPLLKIELLSHAACQAAKIIISIRSKLAEQGIELMKAPKASLFSLPTSNRYPFEKLSFQTSTCAASDNLGKTPISP